MNDSTFPTPGGFEYGVYNLFKLDLATLSVSPVDFGLGSNRSPVVSPNGKMVAYVSNRNGIDNIYLGYMDSVKYYAVTDVLTGIRDLSWSPDGHKLAFSSFHNGGFDVFVMKDFVPVGENGVLKPTDFMLGKYNNPFKKSDSKDAVARVGDSTLVTHQSLVSATSDSTSAIPADSTLAAKPVKDSIITETGIHGEDFVFVSNHPVDPMDSLLRSIPGDSIGDFKKLKEPASFDSIPSPNETGEYTIHKYKVKFTPDYVGGGFAYDTFFGVRGQSVFVFSDYLGNHQILIATDIVNTIDQSYVQAFYVNNASRIHFGGGFFHTKNFYEDADNFLFSDRYYGVSAFAEHPFSIFSRVDGMLSQIFIDRKYYEFDDPREDRSTKITYGSASYVFDNVLWGWTGPINGKRFKLTFDAARNLFDSKDISFYAADMDYRRYWDISKAVSFAVRAAGGASFGRTPKTYFVGGVSNWIGSRDLDAPVYEVENLYFADIITPLRGQPLYGRAGNRYGVVSAELRFPLVQVLAFKYPLPLVFQNIQGAIFADMGGAWTGSAFKGGTSEGGNKRLQDIHTGFGCGMRLNVGGLALLRYDVAWSTDFDKVSDRPTHYFSLGADF